MTYKYDEDASVDLKVYFEQNKDKLPQLAVITGGVYGKTKFDDFASDQVIRFHRYTTQKRVLVKNSAPSGKEQFLSIPVNTDIKFQVIKGRNKFGPEESLSSILKRNKLPVFLNIVSPAPSAIDKAPGGLRNQLLVTEEYTEYYLQGHCVADGCINPSDVSTAIVIPDITATNIQGFTDNSDEKFREHLKQLDDQVKKHAKFDNNDVDKDIRVIECKKEENKTEEEPDSGDEYEYIDPPPLPEHRKLSSSDEKTATSIGRPQAKAVPGEKVKPSVPPRGPLPKPPDQKPFSKDKSHKAYENDKVHVVNPVVKHQEDAIYEPDIYVDADESKPEVSAGINIVADDNVHQGESPSAVFDDIESKNVNDILKILKKLKLGKYSEMFEEDIVDGMTLKNFTEDELKKEYKMRHAEAVRLMNYVRHGHIPK